jgi:hypothetical protein
MNGMVIRRRRMRIKLMTIKPEMSGDVVYGGGDQVTH